MSDNALSFSPTKWSIIGAAFSNGHENQEKNQDCGNRPICCGCHKHHRENSEWVVFSDKTWWHAFCAAEELFRQLAQRDERNAALEAEIVELRRAINGIAPTDPTRFEDLDLCVALNNHADLAAVRERLMTLERMGVKNEG